MRLQELLDRYHVVASGFSVLDKLTDYGQREGFKKRRKAYYGI
ncbi:hypothetical protein ABEX92_16775 [Bacillus safensis subsp. osmophilus]